MYDLTIIGAGTGGYAAAIRAAQLGVKVCIVEKDLLGGTCLNRGCIPTKSIINSVKILRGIKKAEELGIDIKGHNTDIDRIFKHKDDIVLRLRGGVESLLKSKGIDIMKGVACIFDRNTVKVNGGSISSKYIIIATGSMPVEQDNLKFDHRHILSSDDILKLRTIPKSMVVIGGGYIGCEFASIYNQLGSKVTIVEIQNQLLPSGDKEIAKRLEATFKKQGIDTVKGAKVVSVDSKDNAKLVFENDSCIEADIALLSIGRKPNIDKLNLDKAGIKTANGKIVVDDKLRTNIPNIYTAGDVTGRYYLAHVASYEGVVASENIFGTPRSVDYSAVPSCIFTFPEISSIGLTEDEARESGLECSVTRVPFAAISKAHILGEREGFIKLISDAKTDKILGAHIFGASASELIAEFAIAMQNNITVKALSEVIYAHPTLSEGILEAVCRVKEHS